MTGTSASSIVGGTKKVFNLGGELVAYAGGLWNGSLSEAVKYTQEFGLSGMPVWTGSNPFGAFSSSDCLGWASSSGAQVGTSGSASSAANLWVNQTAQACNLSAALYCISQ
jgi:hypothetical protein